MNSTLKYSRSRRSLPPACVVAFVFITSAQQLTAQFPDFMPQRGVYPNGAYAFDKLEAINQANGILTYTLPLTSLPLGRSGMTVPVNLVYSSALFDVYYNQSQNTTTGQVQILGTAGPSSFGGWSFGGYRYGLYFQSPSFLCPSGNVSTTPPYRLSMIMPDGAHHNLKLYGQADDGSGDSAYWFSPIDGSRSCGSSKLGSPLNYFTSDGSYIKVQINTQGDQWTISLPNGTVASGTGLASGEVDATSIQDRNGNNVTITTNSSGATVLTDDLQRTITISGSPNSGTVTQTGFSGSPLTWTLGGQTSTIVTLNTCPTNFTYPTCGGYQGGGPSWLQIPTDSGTLMYQFGYDSTYGYLNSVTLPSGAKTTYTDVLSFGGLPLSATGFEVTAKQVIWTDQSDGGNVQRTESWSYSRGQCNSGSNCTATITKPDNGQHTTYFHYGNLAQDPFVGLTVKQVEPDGFTTEYLYYQNRPWGSVGYDAANPYPHLTVHSVAQSGLPSLAAVEVTTVDKNGNPTIKMDYDWIPYSSLSHDSNNALSGFTGGTTLETVTNSYSVTTPNADQGLVSESIPDNSNRYWNPGSQRLRNLLTRSVTNGLGTGAVTGFSYDSNGGPSSHGNATQEAHWDSTKAASQPSSLNASNASITNRTYDGYGNLLQITDPNGNVTQYTYGTSSGCSADANLYPTKMIEAYGTSAARTFSYCWDDNLGLVTLKTDVDNNVITSYSYDKIGRQTQVVEAANSLAKQTNTIYDDANERVIVQRDQNSSGDKALVSVTNYDQLYRPTLVQALQSTLQNPYDINAGIKVQTRYLYSGNNSYKLVSNPYCGSDIYHLGNCDGNSAATITVYEQTMGWNLSTVDQNGRVISTESFNGGALPAPWSSGTVSNPTTCTSASSSSSGMVCDSYNANSTTVTDEAGKKRKTTTDGLGRIASVVEDPAGSLNYSTTYTYDALDNLAGVMQSSQVRTFVYDSLKRLTSATNPESGKTAYSYDSNGNVKTKTDARGTVTNFTYDPLNRLKAKSYTLNGAAPTNPVTYVYDTATGAAHGHLTSISNETGTSPNFNGSTTTYNSFDALGRPATSTQTTLGVPYSLQRTYNLAGGLTTETYTSGRVVTTSYNGLNQPDVLGGSLSGTTTNYVPGIDYFPNGAMNLMGYGTGVSRVVTLNSRLQPVQLADALNFNPSLYLWIENMTWVDANQHDNGNLQSVQIFAGGPASTSNMQSFTQTFGYDNVNRLASANEGSAWSQTYNYDAYGNMWTPISTGLQAPQFGPIAPATNVYGTNNQNSVNPRAYDAAGNLILSGAQSLSYDAENHLTSNGAYSYLYDGDGNRVQKSGSPTTYVYDGAGALAAEYTAGAWSKDYIRVDQQIVAIENASSTICRTCYLSVDHLGSTRMVTDQNGNVVSRHDYAPFGQEILSGVGGRTTQWGANDNTNEKFTAKERDAESGLDYFGARYYGSALGRFTSPDPTFLNIRKVLTPQRWNLYGYGVNNPLRFVDPDGNEAVAVYYPGYQVGVHGNFTLPAGHAGVVIIDKNGQTHYFEYGRYSPAGAGGDVAQGVVRNAGAEGTPTPPVERDASGAITPDSMKALLETLSGAAGKHGEVDAVVLNTNDAEDAAMEAYLEQRQSQNSDSSRQHYSLFQGHNCGTLICDALGAGGRRSPSTAGIQGPGSVFGQFLVWPGLYGVTQTFVYAPPKEKVKSKICYPDDKGKMHCQ